MREENNDLIKDIEQDVTCVDDKVCKKSAEEALRTSFNDDNTNKNIDGKKKKGEHLVIMPHNNRKIEINKDTNFGSKGKISDFFYAIAWKLAVGILWVYTKAFLGLKVEGKENLKKLEEEGKGYLVVSNHMHVMDTPLIAVTLRPTKIQFTSIEQNFSIPVAGRILSFFRVLPFPESPAKLKYVFDYINKAVTEGQVIHLFPEGVLMPYNNQLKTFNKGPFMTAEKTKCKILPVVYTQRKAKGPFKYLKEHRCSFTAHILPAQEINQELKKKEAIIDLQTRVKSMMEETIKKFDEDVVGFKYEQIQ